MLSKFGDMRCFDHLTPLIRPRPGFLRKATGGATLGAGAVLTPSPFPPAA